MRIQRRRDALSSNIRHHFDPTRDNQVFHATHDRRSAHVDGRDAAATEPIERDAGRAHGIASVQCRHATDTLRLLFNLATTAHDHVINVLSVEPITLNERLEDRG